MSSAYMVDSFNIRFDDEKVKINTSLEHYHNSYELDFFIKANIDIFIKDSKYSIHDGDILLIKPYDIHKLIYHSSTQYIRYVINFKEEYISDVINTLKIQHLLDWIKTINDRKVTINLQQKTKIEILFKELVEQYKKLDSNNMVSIHANIKMNLVMLLNLLHEWTWNHKSSIIMDKKDHQVQDIIQFIDCHYSYTLTLEDLAKQFFLSKFYISHIFKEITGFSVMEYIQHKRIVEAKKLLRDSSKSVTQICYECGFNNIQHFYRVFKTLSHTAAKLQVVRSQ